MSQVLKFARKEFTDLLNCRLVELIIIFYIIVLLNDLYSIAITPNSDLAGITMVYFGYYTCHLCGLVAIVLGFYAMSSEKTGSALTTILTKPVYRDTIINGKLIGMLAFISCIFWISSIIFLAGLLLIFGGSLISCISLYIIRLPLFFALYILMTIFFYSLAMALTLKIRDEGFALFLSFLSWIIVTSFLNNIVIFCDIYSLITIIDAGQYIPLDFIVSMEPISIINSILQDQSTDLISLLSAQASKFAILALYGFTTLTFAYITFIRRDVA